MPVWFLILYVMNRKERSINLDVKRNQLWRFFIKTMSRCVHTMPMVSNQFDIALVEMRNARLHFPKDWEKTCHSCKFWRLLLRRLPGNNRGTMFSFDDCKNALGPEGKNFTDEEIQRIRDTLMELAEIAYETQVRPWLASKKETDVVKWSRYTKGQASEFIYSSSSKAG